MALNADPVAEAMALAFKAAAPAGGTPITDDDLKAMWKAAIRLLYADIIAHMVVTVPPGVAVATTGSPAAQTGATTAPGIGTVA